MHEDHDCIIVHIISSAHAYSFRWGRGLFDEARRQPLVGLYDNQHIRGDDWEIDILVTTVLTESLYEMNHEDQLRTCRKKMMIYRWLGLRVFNQSINQHIYLNITATAAGFKKTNTHKFEIKLIKNNQIFSVKYFTRHWGCKTKQLK